MHGNDGRGKDQDYCCTCPDGEPKRDFGGGAMLLFR
jgi:hypothetical protein